MLEPFFLIGLVIPCLTFLFEIYPRLLNRKFGVDIWTHLLYLKEYRRQGKMPRDIGEKRGFLVPGDYDYPPIFILILSRFPLKLVEKYEFIFSPFFDFILNISIFFISFYLTSNIYLSILTQAIYTLTPIIILENSSATPRSIGYSLFNFLFISLFLYLQNGQIGFLLLVLFCGTLIFLSHRFTTQGFFFFSIFFSIFEKNILFLGVFVISLILAITLSSGFYLKVLKGHLGNLHFWYKNSKFRFYHQIKGSYEEHKTQDFIFKLYNQFLKFPPFVLGITNPWTFPALFMLFSYDNLNYIEGRLFFLVLFSYFLALATTWVPTFRFLGEGQRYLELTAFPAAFLSSKFLMENLNSFFGQFLSSAYIFIGFASLITIIVIQRKGIIKDELRTVTPDIQKMFSYLKSLKRKPRLLCIPHQITTNTIYHTGCSVFVNANYESMNKISEVYPYVKKPLRMIMKKYALDMILLNEDYVKASELKLGKYSIIRRVGRFALISP